MEFGEKIASLRKSNGMTQSELGTRLNVTFQAVSKWERGESYPDFETLSKISKIFGVSLNYFEDAEGEQAESETEEIAAASVEQAAPQPKMIGFCHACGKVVYENDEATTAPKVTCKQCYAKQMRAECEKQAAQKALAQKKERVRQAHVNNVLKRRNRGLIASAVICAAIFIILLISIVSDPEDWGYSLIGMAIVLLFGYTFFAQLFWDGIVFEICVFGGKIVGMPGVIFTLDLDGIIFLAVVKILFAILKLLIFVLTFLLAAFVAALISPFTFVPQLRKLNRGEEL